jgi:hypothetical protein
MNINLNSTCEIEHSWLRDQRGGADNVDSIDPARRVSEPHCTFICSTTCAWNLWVRQRKAHQVLRRERRLAGSRLEFEFIREAQMLQPIAERNKSVPRWILVKNMSAIVEMNS